MLKKSQIKFIIYSLTIFLVIFLMLYSIGLVPESIKPNNGDSLRTLWDKAQENAIKKQADQANVGEAPVRIVIDKIGVDSIISNPNTTNIATLDEYLKQGAVRYPGSGLIGVGNMLIFAHSAEAYVILNNQALKAFNGLKNLRSGDIIKIYGSAEIYEYRVKAVTLVDANQALVTLGGTKNTLTLSTCNTFGAKSERYVVEADFVGTI